MSSSRVWLCCGRLPCHWELGLARLLPAPQEVFCFLSPEVRGATSPAAPDSTQMPADHTCAESGFRTSTEKLLFVVRCLITGGHPEPTNTPFITWLCSKIAGIHRKSIIENVYKSILIHYSHALM